MFLFWFANEIEKRKQNQGTASGAEGEVFHPGVVCDGCEGSIRGPRFKCISCPDYDLCKQCEEKGLHPEHEFVKFRKPVIGRTHQGVSWEKRNLNFTDSKSIVNAKIILINIKVKYLVFCGKQELLFFFCLRSQESKITGTATFTV